MQRTYCLSIGSLILLCAWFGHIDPVQAGMIGFPAARQQPRHIRLEVAVDSFKEDLKNMGGAEATTGRALVTAAVGLTSWSEVFVRLGLGEFNVDEALFSGDFGLAYGGGLRFLVWRFPFGRLGLTGQYLRFTSDDDDSAGISLDGEWEEFDVAVGIGTTRFGAFQFYAGGAYHDTDITITGGPSRTNLEADVPFRAFLGIHIYPFIDFPRGEFVINVEARLIGETPQFTFGVQYSF